MNNIWSVENHMKHCEYEPESLQRNIIQAAPFNAWNKAEPNHFSNYWCHFSAQSELRWIHVWRASAQKNLNLLSLYLTFSDLNFLPFCIPSNCICIIFQLTLHSLPDLRRKGKSQLYKHTHTQRRHTHTPTDTHKQQQQFQLSLWVRGTANSNVNNTDPNGACISISLCDAEPSARNIMKS